MEYSAISRYEVIEKIGSGGLGSVYLARHKNLNTKVVLKAEKVKKKISEVQLRREVDILKTLKHPYIPVVYDYFVEDNMAYTVMEYIEGESLEKFMEDGKKFRTAEITKWAIQLLEALQYLHSPIHGDPPRGYVHSDIKPGNIMIRPNGDISLIDFNVSLAIGEETVLGYTKGYASPEHYGVYYTENTVQTHRLIVEDSESVSSMSGSSARDSSGNSSSGNSGGSSGSGAGSSTVRKVRITPDERSDLFSVGALLYHMISGQKPASRVWEVAPLSPKVFNPQIAFIVNKAMNPDPDLRFQTAGEMLQAFYSLKKNDPRRKSLQRRTIVMAAMIAAILVGGIASAMIGLNRMQIKEKWLNLTESSNRAYANGDVEGALRYAVEACPKESGLFTPAIREQTQLALTQALEAYKLSDGYRIDRIAELPSEPLFMDIARDGRYAACICLGQLVIIDTQSGEIVTELPAEESALAEVRFVDANTILFAGREGLTAYDINGQKELWHGSKITGLALSGNKRVAAGIYKDAHECYLYDVQSGSLIRTIDLGDHYQPAAVNNIGFNPNDNLLALNEDGSKLGVSLDGGLVKIYDLYDESKNLEISDAGARFGHFEGGFYKNLFLFAGSDGERAEIVVVDVTENQAVFNKADFGRFHVAVGEDCFWISRDNRVMKYDPDRKELEQYYACESLIKGIAKCSGSTRDSGGRIIAVTDSEIVAMDEKGVLLSRTERNDPTDVVSISGETLIAGNYNSNVMQIMKYADRTDTACAVYDPSYLHFETRVSADGKYLILSTDRDFAIFRRDGAQAAFKELPNADRIYDQQVIREGSDSVIEITYYDGTIDTYDGTTGKQLGSEKGEAPDRSLHESLVTEHYVIENQIHENPVVHARDLNAEGNPTAGRALAEIDEDAYLTYADETDGYLVLRFITTDLRQYGCLYDRNFRLLARMPELCDVYDGKLYFDYQDGTVRESPVYSLDELLRKAKDRLRE